MNSANTVSPFWRISEERKQCPDLTKENIGSVSGSLVLVLNGYEIRDQALANYLGHHQFHRTRPRRTWFDAKCPVYFDFGDEVICQLVEYNNTRECRVRIVAKRKLIHDAMVESRANDIATRFYPIT